AADAPKAIKSPNERPRMALVGAGGMGTGDARSSLRFADLVAVCDVDDSHSERCATRLTEKNGGKKPEKYSDFRKLLERDDIDVIINGTPDHWHSLINIGAAKAKKDIYSEKPLTLTIDEGKQVVKAVRDNKVVLQTGTQQRSSARFRMACELVRNGRIGKLKEVNVWLPAGVRKGPFKTQPVPDSLNWDYWQGQAKNYDYVPERCHVTFRNWWDYSGGTMTDWGAHHMDIGYWAIGLTAPSKISGKPYNQPIPGGYTTFSEYEVRFEYSNGIIFNVRTTTDDSPFGQVLNPAGQRNGIRFEGTDGWIWVNRGSIKASDRELLRKPLADDAERLYVSNDHRGNFFDCVKSRKDPICPVEVGHRSASVCHLGTIALRSGKSLQWDGKKEFFVGEHAEEANGYVARKMRKPYDYSFVS
ncbi:MAG: Gfo/Idh/MocA family oxidoreductase, partial [Verrucomicrobiae bacterium]|nr:Gfo/Idh/MocA family oxidoreductase [Verrucomicrobiae bacterium]NNJ86540.1 Gfo/Idh/MocA family oxidoreductase [Akkermansiaceae bacterium]